jgi:hypothetical protein
VIGVELLRVALLALVVTLGLMILALFAHALWNARTSRRHAVLLRSARLALARLLESEEIDASAYGELERLPRRLQIRLLAEVALPLIGAPRRRVTEIYTRLGLVSWALARTRSALWWRRLRAVRVLTLLDAAPGELRRLLDDPHPLVRAQVIEWSVRAPDEALVEALLDHLGDPSRLCRFTVEDALIRMGGTVSTPLALRLAEAEEPALEPALRVATALAESVFLPSALRHAGHDDPSIRARAATLLGSIGGEDAVARLGLLLGDEHARVRAAAATALGDLGQWTAAPAVAPLLRDDAWDVRRAAGLALRAMGSPGAIFLRRYRNDGDEAAAGMARQVLDLPGAPRQPAPAR